MDESTAIRVLIADDRAAARSALAGMLAGFDDLLLVGEAGDGLEALHQAAELHPDVVLMDLVMPGLDGLNAAEVLCRTYPQMRVIVLADFPDEALIRRALAAGAVSFLAKSTPADELAQAIRAAARWSVDETQSCQVGGLQGASLDAALQQAQSDPWAGWFSGEKETRRVPALVPPAPPLAAPRDQSGQAEQDLLGAVLDTTGALVIVLDREGRIVRFNRSCERATGYDVSEVRGRLLWDVLIPPEEAPTARQQFEQLLRGDFPAHHESRVITKAGRQLWIAWSTATVGDGRGGVDFVIATGIDLTEREQARAALQWEVGVNAALADLSGALIALVSLEDISDLVLEHAKRLTESAFGFVGYIDPQTGAFVSSTMTRDIWDSCRVADKEVVFHEFRGLWGWALQHHQSIVANNPAADPRSTGVPAGHIPIQRFLAAPAMLGDHLVGLVALANPSRVYTEQDQQLVERLGQLYALAIQRQRAEADLREHALQLQARNAELDAFAHTVAHDLKGPLSLILGYGQILVQYEALGAAERQQAVSEILRTGRRMNGIIKELLLLASMRQEEVTTHVLDTGRIVAAALDRVASSVAESQPRIAVPEAWPEAWGYAPWVEEVWVNYLSNALKYGGDPPHVELGAEEQPNGQVRFWIRDNGAGLTAEEQARLFQPFTRLQPVRAQGYGLGLSIVQHIAGRLGGQAGVESEVGRGSTFYFTLPAYRSGPDAEEAQ